MTKEFIIKSWDDVLSPADIYCEFCLAINKVGFNNVYDRVEEVVKEMTHYRDLDIFEVPTYEVDGNIDNIDDLLKIGDIDRDEFEFFLPCD